MKKFIACTIAVFISLPVVAAPPKVVAASLHDFLGKDVRSAVRNSPLSLNNVKVELDGWPKVIEKHVENGKTYYSIEMADALAADGRPDNRTFERMLCVSDDIQSLSKMKVDGSNRMDFTAFIVEIKHIQVYSKFANSIMNIPTVIAHCQF